MNKSKLFLLISRYILGAIILIFGFNEYHNLIPIQQTGTEELNALIGGLKSTGYLYYAVKIVEFTAGVLLVGGFFVPFANLMLFPVLLNIFLANLFLNPAGLVVASIMMVASVYIFYYYREIFKLLFEYNIYAGTDMRDQINSEDSHSGKAHA